MKKNPLVVVSVRAILGRSRGWVLVITLVLVLETAAFPQTYNRHEIPYQNSRVFGLVVIRVEANGKPAVLIVDTASDHTILSSDFGQTPPRTLASAVSTSKGSGLTGTGVFATATLKVGPITWRDHQVVIMDLHDFSKSFGQKIDGLLGADFLNEFERVTFDSRHHKLILEP